jgi:hypothetical protein
MANKSNIRRSADQGTRDSQTAQPVDRPQELPPHVQPPRAARRPEMIQKRRTERRLTYERERRQWLLTRIGIGAVAVLLVAAIGYVVFASMQRSRVPAGTEEFTVDAGHTVETVAYDPVPPVGGEHDATPQTCGFYAIPIRSENAVHSLEHGAIWITYRPDLSSEQVDRLRTLAEDEGKVLVSPFDELPAPVVVSSWGRRLLLGSVEDDRLGQFVQRFRGDAPEPRAACVGVGTPL